jgi:hypothetical protein
MPSSPEEQFQARRRLVQLFRAQLELLREADPDGIGREVDAVNLGPYDQLLAQGPKARWPAGFLAGLKEGIRDVQHTLELAYGPGRRSDLLRHLRERAGDAIGVLEARDASRLEAILKRGRIRGDAEYYLVRAAIDRLESERQPDEARLQALRALADETEAK